MQIIQPEQYKFLTWLNRNYEWLKSKGFEPPIQSYPHWLYDMIRRGNYTEEDKGYINYTIKFLRNIGLKTYHSKWTWDKNGAELDWIINVKLK